MKNTKIVIEAHPGGRVEFKSREALIAHAIQLLETCGGLFSPLDQRVMLQASLHIDQPTSYEERRVQDIGRRFGFFNRAKLAPEPTPLDGELAEAEQEREKAIARQEEMKELMFRAIDAKRAAEREGDPGKLTKAKREETKAKQAWEEAAAAESRARVRVTALAEAAARWRNAEAYTRNLKEAAKNRAK